MTDFDVAHQTASKTFLMVIPNIKIINHFSEVIFCKNTKRNNCTLFIPNNGTYVDVIVRNLSCPAVSQICNFTISPSTLIFLILKSTPIVVI